MTIKPIESYNGIYFAESAKRNRFFKDLTFFRKARERAGIMADGQSFVRNTTSAVKAVTVLPAISAMAVNGSAVVGGALGVPVGLCMVRDSLKKGQMALAARDGEGVVQNAAWGGMGATFTGISGIVGAEGIMGLSGAAIPAAMTPALGGLGFIMYGLQTLYGLYGWKQTNDFANKLDELKKEGTQKTLEWLQQQNSLSKEEVEEIYHISNEPTQEIARRLQKKWNAFDFRTNSACGKMVREKLAQELDEKQAQELIQEVEKANYKEKLKHKLLLLIAVVGIVAFTALLVLAGPFSPALFALGGLLWLTLDSSVINNYLGEKGWNRHLKNKESSPFQRIDNGAIPQRTKN